MFRTIVFFGTLMFYAIYGFFLWFAAWIVHFFSQEKADYMIFNSVRRTARLALRIAGMKVEVYGKNRTGFVAKDSLNKVPVFRIWIKKLNGLFLNRDDIREGVKTIQKATENVKSGISMCIFPEGTRNKDLTSKTSMLPFHPGSLKIAERSDAPVIPVAIYNTGEVFEGNHRRMKPSTIKMTFGKPIEVAGLSKAEKRFLSKRVEETLQEMLNAYEK